MSEIFETVKESLTMCQVAQHFGYEPNRSGFIHSPFSNERTPSCKLYHNSFYDFSTNTGGDLINFAAKILSVNNWESCRYLVDAFSLPISLSGRIDNREAIEQRRRERQRKQEKEQRFKVARIAEIDHLKKLEWIYNRSIELCLFPVFSELWGFTIVEREKYLID